MRTLIVPILALLAVSPALAQQTSRDAFATGPVFEDFGAHAPVETAEPIPSFSRFEIAFDVATAAAEGARNRGFESAARFMNMHVAAGVPADRISLVVVVHGTAAGDLVTGKGNGSEAMVRAMLERGVRFIICGQSMAARGVNPDELIDGVETQLSAMTAHALLQQQGYTVNPF
jgi:intracellular sulfur oxidation DsrE/DsrF family protein